MKGYLAIMQEITVLENYINGSQEMYGMMVVVEETQAKNLSKIEGYKTHLVTYKTNLIKLFLSITEYISKINTIECIERIDKTPITNFLKTRFLRV